MKKNWDIFLIHHSHTDIGYTERQDKIIKYHHDFIKQAINILNGIHDENNSKYNGFKWQCENHWQIKNFYECASDKEIQDFEKYVKSGEIGLSGNYLNMTELINFDILNSRIAQAKEYGEKIGVEIKSGMSADINGFAWGYADALYENGIRNHYSCLHPHHGMFPLYKKQIPFYWESPKGNKILVWNGEHYHFGNELHFAPNAGSSYMIFDTIRKNINADVLYKSNAEQTEQDEFAVLDERLVRYLENFEEEGYEYDFMPIMVSGCITDNSPPNAEIVTRINKMNARHKNINIKMVTLDEFFEQVTKRCDNIPTYKGDWNDWWADGVSSTPAVVKIFKEAQRKYNICKKLDADTSIGDDELLEQAAENLMLYAEHTWGYSSSVSEPWESLVGELEYKKAAYAINGNTCIAKNLDNILCEKGEVSIKQFKPQRYKVVNPHDMDLKTTALLYVEFWEYINGVDFNVDVPIEVIDERTGKVLKSQVKRIARAFEIEVQIDVKAKEEYELSIRLSQETQERTVKNHAHIGAEGIEDVIIDGVYQENFACVETDYFKFVFDEKTGVKYVIDKADGKEMINATADDEYVAFGGVYEITDIKEDANEERRRMGRNRKDASTKRYFSKLSNIEVVENGDVFVAVQLDYELEGTEFYSVILKIYKGLQRFDATVRIHKQSKWEPENLYIALPFTSGNDTKYVDKTGCIIRPGIDQLPGTNKEFYLIQNGAVFEGDTKSLVISSKDAPLVTFGGLEAKPITLCSGEDFDFNKLPMFSWVMNNYWETNFKVDLGGFYEFRYSVSVARDIDVKDAFNLCEAQNEGILSYYV